MGIWFLLSQYSRLKRSTKDFSLELSKIWSLGKKQDMPTSLVNMVSIWFINNTIPQRNANKMMKICMHSYFKKFLTTKNGNSNNGNISISNDKVYQQRPSDIHQYM